MVGPVAAFLAAGVVAALFGFLVDGQMDSVTDAHRRAESAAQVREQVVLLEAAIADQLLALEAGDRDRATEIDEQRVDPLYDAISDNVDELRDHADQDANAAAAPPGGPLSTTSSPALPTERCSPTG